VAINSAVSSLRVFLERDHTLIISISLQSFLTKKLRSKPQ